MGGACDGRVRAGFTLIEVLLVLALLVLMAGISFFSLTSWRAETQFTEGMDRFETMLRMARCDAATQGRRVRLSFDANDGSCQILWEPQPLEKPNVFVDYSGATWAEYVPNDMLRVTRSQLTGESAVQWSALQPASAEADIATLQDVTFYPDGSCDSAELELAPQDTSDNRRVLLSLDGFSGVVTRFDYSTESEPASQAGGQP